MHTTFRRLWPADPWRLATFVALCAHAVLGSAAITLGVSHAVDRSPLELGFHGAVAVALLVSAAVGVALGLVGVRWYDERVGVAVAAVTCLAAVLPNVGLAMALVLRI